MLLFVSLFVCGGKYTKEDVQRWVNSVASNSVMIIKAGKCSLNIHGASIYEVPLGHPAKNVGNVKYEYMHAKFYLWSLPCKRVAYYDIDTLIKSPTHACANMCPSHKRFCAVRDPVATWPVKSKTYFNAGFMVLTPNKTITDELVARGTDNRRFAEQDTLNEYFDDWHKLPKQCNWLHFAENHPNAKKDPSVHMVHTVRTTPNK